jgi:hypothetical protein
LEKIKRYTAGGRCDFYEEEDENGDLVRYFEYEKMLDSRNYFAQKTTDLYFIIGYLYGSLLSGESEGLEAQAIKDFLKKIIESDCKIDPSEVIATDEAVNVLGEPEVIYLQIHGEQYEAPADYKAEITWCWHKINECDVRYIRADKIKQIAVPGLIPSTFRTWWAMIEAGRELEGRPLKDFDVVLQYMGNGSSCEVTAGQIRKMLK